MIESVSTPSIADQVTDLLAREDTHLREARVQRGETLAALFGRLGISDTAALRFAQTDASARPLSVGARPLCSGEHYVGWPSALAESTRRRRSGRCARDHSHSDASIGATKAAPGFRAVEADVALERRVEFKAAKYAFRFSARPMKLTFRMPLRSR